jgi:predicted transposase YbfD/YdcC
MNTVTPIEKVLQVFREVPDPRMERTKIHSLEIILFIALCASLSGGESFYAMELYARTKEAWLKKNVDMVSIPSHDTFNRVFQAISPELFGKCLMELSERLREKVSGDVVAFDGKTHRRTGDKKRRALHMLNAWSVENRLVLGQLAVEEKSNEITAMPQLMEILDLKGCIITVDALNCQKEIAKKALSKGADYIFAVKGNHRTLYNEIVLYMDDLSLRTAPGYESVDKEHGRIDIRRCWQTVDIGWCEEKDKWAGLRSFCMIESNREEKGKSEISRRYYISSLGLDASKVAHSIRSHWHIENSLHWCLDVIFNEDQSRARVRNAAKNLGTLRAICLNIIKRIPGKSSMKGKRFQIALSDDYLLQALRI